MTILAQTIVCLSVCGVCCPPSRRRLYVPIYIYIYSIYWVLTKKVAKKSECTSPKKQIYNYANSGKQQERTREKERENDCCACLPAASIFAAPGLPLLSKVDKSPSPPSMLLIARLSSYAQTPKGRVVRWNTAGAGDGANGIRNHSAVPGPTHALNLNNHHHPRLCAAHARLAAVTTT